MATRSVMNSTDIEFATAQIFLALLKGDRDNDVNITIYKNPYQELLKISNQIKQTIKKLNGSITHSSSPSIFPEIKNLSNSSRLSIGLISFNNDWKSQTTRNHDKKKKITKDDIEFAAAQVILEVFLGDSKQESRHITLYPDPFEKFMEVCNNIKKNLKLINENPGYPEIFQFPNLNENVILDIGDKTIMGTWKIKSININRQNTIDDIVNRYSSLAGMSRDLTEKYKQRIENLRKHLSDQPDSFLLELKNLGYGNNFIERIDHWLPIEEDEMFDIIENQNTSSDVLIEEKEIFEIKKRKQKTSNTHFKQFVEYVYEPTGKNKFRNNEVDLLRSRISDILYKLFQKDKGTKKTLNDFFESKGIKSEYKGEHPPTEVYILNKLMPWLLLMAKFKSSDNFEKENSIYEKFINEYKDYQSQKIFFLTKNKKNVYEWKHIIDVLPDNIKIIDKTLTEGLNDLMKPLIECIKVYDKITNRQEIKDKLRPLISNNNEDDLIYLLLVRKLAYRECNVYIFIQYSQKTHNVRYVVYGTNTINHSRAGASIEIVPYDEVFEDIRSSFGETKFDFVHSNPTEREVYRKMEDAFMKKAIIMP